MKVLICGSRDWEDREAIRDFIYSRCDSADVLVHGAARGADSIAAEIWCEVNTAEGSVRGYPADWEGPCDLASGMCVPGHRLTRNGREYCPSAGPRRNQAMLDDERPDLVAAFLLPQSRGTRDMIRRATQASIPVEIFTPTPSAIEEES